MNGIVGRNGGGEKDGELGGCVVYQLQRKILGNRDQLAITNPHLYGLHKITSHIIIGFII